MLDLTSVVLYGFCCALAGGASVAMFSPTIARHYQPNRRPRAARR